MNTNLALKLRAARKSAWRQWKFSTEPLYKSKLVQGVLVFSALSVVLLSLFWFLSSLLGLALAALTILAVLENVFGWKWVGPFGPL